MSRVISDKKIHCVCVNKKYSKNQYINNIISTYIHNFNNNDSDHRRRIRIAPAPDRQMDCLNDRMDE